MTNRRHFLGLEMLEPETLRAIVDHALALKRAGTNGARPLDGKMLAAIFEVPSTRTRVSFDVAMRQLGGDTISLTSVETQLGRGETERDTARVLSRYVDAIVIRTRSHETLLALADAADVPVINGLTDRTHPCQLIADIMTFEEVRGPITGKTVAWLGDGNNMATSWVQSAAQFGFALRLACPEAHAPDPAVLAWARQRGADITTTADVEAAAAGADCVVTDTWVSLSDSNAKSIDALAPYQVNERIMALAATDAIFMHCLPAKRGQEVVDAVMDGPQSVVFEEAANRVPAQKAILLWCFGAL